MGETYILKSWYTKYIHHCTMRQGRIRQFHTARQQKHSVLSHQLEHAIPHGGAHYGEKLRTRMESHDIFRGLRQMKHQKISSADNLPDDAHNNTGKGTRQY